MDLGSVVRNRRSGATCPWMGPDPHKPHYAKVDHVDLTHVPEGRRAAVQAFLEEVVVAARTATRRSPARPPAGSTGRSASDAMRASPQRSARARCAPAPSHASRSPTTARAGSSTPSAPTAPGDANRPARGRGGGAGAGRTQDLCARRSSFLSELRVSGLDHAAELVRALTQSPDHATDRLLADVSRRPAPQTLGQALELTQQVRLGGEQRPATLERLRDSCRWDGTGVRVDQALKVALQPPGRFEFPHSSLMWGHAASCIVPLDGRADAASPDTAWPMI